MLEFADSTVVARAGQLVYFGSTWLSILRLILQYVANWVTYRFCTFRQGTGPKSISDQSNFNNESDEDVYNHMCVYEEFYI